MLKRLDRRITIERFNESTNKYNEAIEVWNVLTTVWASKEDVKDSERFAAGQKTASITTRFQVRYSPEVSDISPLDRVAFEGRSFEIIGVKEIGRREGLEITASARSDLKPIEREELGRDAEWSQLEW